MKAPIRSRGRRGSTSVPNWRWEDVSMDPHTLRVAGWIASHTDHYVEQKVTRNFISRCTGVSAGKVSSALTELVDRGIIEVVNQREEKVRLEIIFDHEVWEKPPPRWSPGDHEGGHDVTTGGHEVTNTKGHSVEAQGETPLTPQGGSEVGVAAETKVEVVDPWERAFGTWYSGYPKKVGRPAALKAFKAKLKGMSDGEMNQLSLGSLAWMRHWAEARTEMQYIPYPATFLNREQYNDIPPVAATHPKPNSPMGILQAIANRDNQ